MVPVKWQIPGTTKFCAERMDRTKYLAFNRCEKIEKDGIPNIVSLDCLTVSSKHKWSTSYMKRCEQCSHYMGEPTETKCSWKREEIDDSWFLSTKRVRGRRRSASCGYDRNQKVCGKVVRIWSKSQFHWTITIYYYTLHQAILESGDKKMPTQRGQLSCRTTIQLPRTLPTGGKQLEKWVVYWKHWQ